MSLQVVLPRCIGQPLAIKDSTIPVHSWSLGVGVGITTLPSLQATYRFQKRWALRAEYNYMGYNQSSLKLAQGRVNADVQVRLSRWALVGHYLPFRTENFGILVGLAAFPNKTVATTFSLAQKIQVDRLLITPAAVGTGFFKLGCQHNFAPYIGITFGRPVPVGASGLRLDLGTYYGGAFDFKQLTIDSKIFLKENEANIGVLERNFNRLPFYYRLIPDLKMVWVCRI